MLTSPFKTINRGPLMQKIRELAETGTSMDVDAPEIRELLATANIPPREARRIDRAYRKIMRFKDAVSHDAMNRAVKELQNEQRAFDEWMGDEHEKEKTRIARLRSQDEVEHAEADLAIERRRRERLRDEGAARFRRLEDRRGDYDSMLLENPALFPGETVWVDPRAKLAPPREPKTHIPQLYVEPAKIDENAPPPFDYTKLALGGEPVYLVVDAKGRMLGDTEFGPLVFRRGAVADKYTDTPKLAIHRITLTPHEVEAAVKAFREAPKYLTDPPPDSEWLYQIVPELQKLSRDEPFVADLKTDYAEVEW